MVSATSGCALLSIYAAKLANGSLALLVVNKHPTTDLAAQIALSNFTLGSTAVPVYAYGKPNDMANADPTTGAASVAGTTISYTFPRFLFDERAHREGPVRSLAGTEFHHSGVEQLGAQAGDDGQPAQDGIPNLMKYALGLNAKDARDLRFAAARQHVPQWQELSDVELHRPVRLD